METDSTSMNSSQSRTWSNSGATKQFYFPTQYESISQTHSYAINNIHAALLRLLPTRAKYTIITQQFIGKEGKRSDTTGKGILKGSTEFKRATHSWDAYRECLRCTWSSITHVCPGSTKVVNDYSGHNTCPLTHSSSRHKTRQEGIGKRQQVEWTLFKK